jgi:hypothetical protein
VFYKFLALYLLSGNPGQPTIVDSGYHQISSHGSLVQEHHWRQSPTVIVCNSINIKPIRLKSALKFWEDLGYTFDRVYFASRQNYVCASGVPAKNQIMIDIPSTGFPFEKHIGNTKTWYNKENGEIMKVKIEIVHGWSGSARILEHELGHALGWKDFAQTGHIMNGVWARSGYTTKGLEKKNGNNNN